MEIKGLRVNRMKDPIGVDYRAPLFSFQTDCDGIFCVSVFVRGESTPIRERVVTASECDGFSFLKPFTAQTRYCWQVSDGRHVAKAYFETGIDFSFPYMVPSMPTRTAPMFCCVFDVPRDCLYARLYIAGADGYHVRLNGEPIGKGDWNVNPSSGLHCRVHDVSNLLWLGSENELKVLMRGPENAYLSGGLVMYLSTGKKINVGREEDWTVFETADGQKAANGVGMRVRVFDWSQQP